jgi:hypothetical protein
MLETADTRDTKQAEMAISGEKANAWTFATGGGEVCLTSNSSWIREGLLSYGTNKMTTYKAYKAYKGEFKRSEAARNESR